MRCMCDNTSNRVWIFGGNEWNSWDNQKTLLQQSIQKCMKALVLVTVIAVDFEVKIQILRKSQSWSKQDFVWDKICLFISISDWKIKPRCFIESLG